MRDLSKLLWSDLTSDEERFQFIQSGRARETGIGFAPVMVPEILAIMRLRMDLREKYRGLLVAAGAELSAIARGQPPSEKTELFRISDGLRELCAELEA